MESLVDANGAVLLLDELERVVQIHLPVRHEKRDDGGRRTTHSFLAVHENLSAAFERLVDKLERLGKVRTKKKEKAGKVK